MPNPATPAGPAAPTPLPILQLRFAHGQTLATVSGLHEDPLANVTESVCLSLSGGRHRCPSIDFLTPAEARELAVYLVDLANRLDDPAARVIADDDDMPDDELGASWYHHCPNGGGQGLPQGLYLTRGEQCDRCGAAS